MESNVNLKVTENVLVIYHNLKGYDSHLIINEIGKFDVKADIIPNGLEKYMAFTINKNLIFIDSMQCMNSSLEKLVKNLSDNNFKYLTQKFSSENLMLLRLQSTLSSKIKIMLVSKWEDGKILKSLFIVATPTLISCHLQPQLHCFFCCTVSLAEKVCYLMWYFTQ